MVSVFFNLQTMHFVIYNMVFSQIPTWVWHQIFEHRPVFDSVLIFITTRIGFLMHDLIWLIFC